MTAGNEPPPPDHHRIVEQANEFLDWLDDVPGTWAQANEFLDWLDDVPGTWASKTAEPETST